MKNGVATCVEVSSSYRCSNDDSDDGFVDSCVSLQGRSPRRGVWMTQLQQLANLHPWVAH